jgi:hypothetical protein
MPWLARPHVPASVQRVWKSGVALDSEAPVHVSMNDYLIHHWRSVPLVVREGLRLRRAWPRTEGALGLWMAAFAGGRRQVSISIWRDPKDLARFVRSPAHLRIMREFRDTGQLYTTAWSEERCDRDLIWQHAEDRLMGRVQGIPHHSPSRLQWQRQLWARGR